MDPIATVPRQCATSAIDVPIPREMRGGADAPSAGTCLVHLVWAPLGPDPLARFLESYRRHRPGAAHRLLIVLNGFQTGHDLGPWRALLADVDHEELSLERPLTDLGAYRQAVERVPAQRYCFLNSYSVVLADGWLGLLGRALNDPGVGLAGATGSWASIRSYQRFMLGLGGYYADVFDDRRATNATLASLATRHLSGQLKTKREPLRFARALLEQSHGFSAFPAAHVRTNGFMIAAEHMRNLTMPRLERKADLYRIESGRESVTAQIRRLGLATVIVGRDGRAFHPNDWAASRTLWQGDQENLLIADNRTEDYALGDVRVRTALSRFAWGKAADPMPGPSRPPQRERNADKHATEADPSVGI